MPRGNCEFNGSGGQYFPTVLIHVVLLSMVTFGIYWPWAWVRVLRLKASHTIINGKKVAFSGAGGDLFVLCIVQGLLSAITLGIYFPWAVCRFLRWRAQNTLVGDRPSEFHGSGASLLGLFIIHFFILHLITFGIYTLFGYGVYRFCAWKEENTRYGGERTSFGGRYTGFLKPHLLGGLLNMITFNLAMPWVLCMLYQWQIGGLAVGDSGEVEHFPPVKTNIFLVIIFLIIGLLPFILIGIPLYHVSQQKGLNIEGMKNDIERLVAEKPKDISKRKKIRAPIKKKPAGVTKKTVKKATAKSKLTKKKKKSKEIKVVKEVKAEKERVDYNEQIKKLNELIKESDDDVNLYYNRAWFYASKGDSIKAIEDYEKVVKLKPDYADAYYNRGILYADMGRFEMAIRDFNKAVELNPKAYDALCNSGNVYYEMGKFKLAVRDYTKALELWPKDADILENRSLAYEAMGKPAEAKADRERAASLRRHVGDVDREKVNTKETDKDSTEPGGDVTSSIEWKKDLKGVEIPDSIAGGMIHGKKFISSSSNISGGSILTIRDGKDFFPDHAVKVFTFIKKGESIEGAAFDINPETGFGSPHIHLQWKPKGKDVPKTEIYMKDYSMRLEFGDVENGFIPGKIYVCLPDDSKSYIAGSFKARIK